MNNLTKEQLELTIAALQQQLDALTKHKQKEPREEPSKPITPWEPKGGDYFVSPTGYIIEVSSTKESREFGSERSTKELAEQAAIEMRAFNRILAYRDEFLDTAVSTKEFIEGERNTYVAFDHSIAEYTTIEGRLLEIVGMPSFPPYVAEELVKKLNSGEVVL